jgi:hypothetical protein
MTRGRALSNDLRGAIVNMARSLDIDSIVRYTGCKRRTVERTLSDYRKKGTAARICLSKELRGAKRALRPADVRVRLLFHSELSAYSSNISSCKAKFVLVQISILLNCENFWRSEEELRLAMQHCGDH